MQQDDIYDCRSLMIAGRKGEGNNPDVVGDEMNGFSKLFASLVQMMVLAVRSQQLLREGARRQTARVMQLSNRPIKPLY